jgi:hypothetical protein
MMNLPAVVMENRAGFNKLMPGIGKRSSRVKKPFRRA